MQPASQCAPKTGQLPREEVQWLKTFYESTNGPGWLNQTGWDKAAADGWPDDIEPCPIRYSGSDGDSPVWVSAWAGIPSTPCAGQGAVDDPSTDQPKPWHLQSIGFDVGRLEVGMGPGTPNFCSGNNLTGALPSSFAALPELRDFFVSGQVPQCKASGAGNPCNPDFPEQGNCRAGIGYLSGDLPNEIAPLLVNFNLLYTHVTGTLPATLIGEACPLINFKINGARITGTIPSSWSPVPCAGMTTFGLMDTPVHGTLPANMFIGQQGQSTTKLENLFLEDTLLSGAIPRLPPSMKRLHVQNAAFTELPDYLKSLTGLLELDATNRKRQKSDGQKLDEAFALHSMTSLTLLKLAAGRWLGTIPKQLGALRDLGVLEMHDNSISGTIPNELCQLTKLKKLTLSANWLEGSIPECFAQLTSVEHIWLNNNHRLSGTIGSWVSQLSEKLTELPLSFNRLSGTIPPEFGELTKLAALKVSDNNFTIDDSMDGWLSRLTKVTEVLISRNFKIESLPATSLRNLPLLEKFEAASRGSAQELAPLSLAAVQLPNSLRKLDLAGNNLHGSEIPHAWNDLENLTYLDLSNCSLADGFNPWDFFEARKDSIQTLLLNMNQLTKVPESIYRVHLLKLDLSNNSIASELRDVMRDIAPGREVVGSASFETSSLQLLDLSHNNITGTIPQNFFSEEWGTLAMAVLDLSWNQLEGTFPAVFTPLPMHNIDVRSNSLTGYLPPSLVQLSDLALIQATGNADMRECRFESCTMRELEVVKGDEIVETTESYCNQVKVPSMPRTIFRLDPMYPQDNTCSCKNDFIGSRGKCTPCSAFAEDQRDLIVCRPGDDGNDASTVRDGYSPVWACDETSERWGSNNCTRPDEEALPIPIAVVRCPVSARYHNPCTNEDAKDGFSPLRNWACREGYTGAACQECDTPGFARELGSRLCVRCEWDSIVSPQWMPFIYIALVIVIVSWLVWKGPSASNLGSTFVFYFQAMTLIKRSILPWESKNLFWTSLTAALNLNPALSGCVEYLRFLDDPEYRFWFILGVPLYCMMISMIVYATSESWDRWGCHSQRYSPDQRLTQTEGLHYLFETIAEPGAEDGQGVQRRVQLRKMKAIDRSYKLLFALLNMGYLPLCFTIFGGSRWATEDFEFFPATAGLRGRYFINAPTVQVPERMFETFGPAEHMELGFWFGLVVFVIGMPAATYRLVYLNIIKHHVDETSGLMKVESRLVQTCGFYFCAYRTGSDPDNDLWFDPRAWPLYVVLPRRVLFTATIAFLPPNSSVLPVCVFFILLLALLLQFRYRPLKGDLDNFLEEATLFLLLVCFTLAQVSMADHEQTSASKEQVEFFVDFAMIFDIVVVSIFAFCIAMRWLLDESATGRRKCLGAWIQKHFSDRRLSILRPSETGLTDTSSTADLAALDIHAAEQSAPGQQPEPEPEPEPEQPNAPGLSRPASPERGDRGGDLVLLHPSESKTVQQKAGGSE